MEVPVGSIIIFPLGIAPSGYLLCDGASYSRDGKYGELFNVIGTTYGCKDEKHFNVPNLGKLMTAKHKPRRESTANNNNGNNNNNNNGNDGNNHEGELERTFFSNVGKDLDLQTNIVESSPQVAHDEIVIRPFSDVGLEVETVNSVVVSNNNNNNTNSTDITVTQPHPIIANTGINIHGGGGQLISPPMLSFVIKY